MIRQHQITNLGWSQRFSRHRDSCAEAVCLQAKGYHRGGAKSCSKADQSAKRSHDSHDSHDTVGHRSKSGTPGI